MNEVINQETGEFMQISEMTADKLFIRAVRIIKNLLPPAWFDKDGLFNSCMSYAIPVRILEAIHVGLGVKTVTPENIEELKNVLYIYTKEDFAKLLARYIFYTLFSEAIEIEPLANLELIHFALAGRKDKRKDCEKLNDFFGYLND